MASFPEDKKILNKCETIKVNLNLWSSQSQRQVLLYIRLCRLLSLKIDRFDPPYDKFPSSQPKHRNIIYAERFEFRKCKLCLQITEYVRYLQGPTSN